MRSPELLPADRRRHYSFSGFELDGEHRQLLRDGKEVTLRSKSMEVLTYLVENHGEVVTKAELIKAAWADTAVTDNSLAQCMVDIRRALDGDSQELIRTVSRRGYLFAAPVTATVLEFAP